MKICWDNLEKLRYNKKTGKFTDRKNSYVYMDFCKKCGDSYLTFCFKISDFCGVSCSKKGKIVSEETKRKISEGIRWEPIQSTDLDMCMTVCKKCHKKIHQKEGCAYQDMQCSQWGD